MGQNLVDISTHTFRANRKGEVWLVFMSIALLGLIAVIGYVLITCWDGRDIGKIAMALVLVTGIGFGCFMLVADWMSYSYAKQVTVEINMQTHTFTYRRGRDIISFKPQDVAHWYVDIGLWASRVSAHQSLIVLRSGEELLLPMWLFEGNRFLMSNDPAYNTFQVNYFILSVHKYILFPEPESAPHRYQSGVFPP